MPKAVIPTDLYGQCADYDRIVEICDGYDVPVIIDAAESLGALYKGRGAGVGGEAAIYSFNGNKIITTSGGGMLASDDEELIEHARKLSQQSREDFPHYEHYEIGYNYRMSNILAAVGRGQMMVLDERVKKKREIFEGYQQALSDVPGIEFMPEAPYGKSNRWLTVILITPCRIDIVELERPARQCPLSVSGIEAILNLQTLIQGKSRFAGDGRRVDG